MATITKKNDKWYVQIKRSFHKPIYKTFSVKDEIFIILSFRCSLDALKRTIYKIVLMTIRLSIIIPVYNTKKYLKECLNSICQQVKQDVELILINDCSTDGSIKICKKFAKKYNFIRLINLKENRGVAHCRNTGI